MVYQLRVRSTSDDFSIARHSKLSEIHWSILAPGFPAPHSISDEPIHITSPDPLRHIITCAADHFLISGECKAIIEAHSQSGDIDCIPMKVTLNSLPVAGRKYFFLNVLRRAQLTDWDRTQTKRSGNDLSPKYQKIGYLPIDRRPGRYFFQAEPSAFSIWQEEDHERIDCVFFPNRSEKYLTNQLWRTLDSQFPNTLVPLDHHDPSNYQTYLLSLN